MKSKSVAPFNFVIMFVVAAGGLMACKNDSEAKMSIEEYQEQSRQLTNITGKLSREQNARKLNEVAKAVEKARPVSCHNVADECDVYGDFLTRAIDVSDDGVLTSTETQELIKLHSQLQVAIQNGINKLGR